MNERARGKIRAKGETRVFPEEELGKILTRRKLTVAVAESCTGGLLSNRITDVPGASSYFLGGIIAYRNDIKRQLLNVSGELLDTYGAVSEETARAMACGCRELFNSAIAIAVTGIAGPGGGTFDKPVGLVYVAVAFESGTTCERFQWSGDRIANKESTVSAALKSVILALGRSDDS